MIWIDKTTGVLECGCRTDAGRNLIQLCAAHRGEGEVKLEAFSLEAAARERELSKSLASARASLRRAQVGREQAHRQLRGRSGDAP